MFEIHSAMFRALVLVTLLPLVFPATSCPKNVCTCKWKGGKETVECINRGLLTIPDMINTNTQVLDFSGNNIRELSDGLFATKGLVNLQRIYLSRCGIEEIYSTAFTRLTNLVDLDLSHNKLKVIEPDMFVHIPALRDLNLAYNSIQKIESHTFEAVPGLVKLDISHCQLRTIAPKAFQGLISFEMLKINDNQLTELRQKTVTTLNVLHGVELHNNPWECDCRLRPMKEWLQDYNIPHPVSPTCDAPSRVADKQFRELHVDDFACRPEVLPATREVTATIGQNATVLCKIGAIPEPHIRWYFHGREIRNNSYFNLGQQRMVIVERGVYEKYSSLVITNAQESVKGEFLCVAENRAGRVQTNFSLAVTYHVAEASTLDGGEIAGISVALIFVILVILVIILFLLGRLRRDPFQSVKPSQGKPKEAERITRDKSEPSAPNPIQKPPRLTDLSYPTSHYNGNGSIVNGTTFARNPDLIPKPSTSPDEEVDKRVVEGHPGAPPPPTDEIIPNTGDYSRLQSDSLYPSGIWSQDDTSPGFAPQYTGFSPEVRGGFALPAHSTPNWKGSGYVVDPQAYGYPADYGLPIPEQISAMGSQLRLTQDTLASYDLSGSGHVLQATSNSSFGSHTNLEPDGSVTTAADPPVDRQKIWQKGVPVLPPFTATLKQRVNPRDSPDEGYQDGSDEAPVVGTDV